MYIVDTVNESISSRHIWTALFDQQHRNGLPEDDKELVSKHVEM